jgi:hypothetical protein
MIVTIMLIGSVTVSTYRYIHKIIPFDNRNERRNCLRVIYLRDLPVVELRPLKVFLVAVDSVMTAIKPAEVIVFSMIRL